MSKKELLFTFIAYPIMFCFVILEKLVGLLDKLPDKDDKK